MHTEEALYEAYAESSLVCLPHEDAALGVFLAAGHSGAASHSGRFTAGTLWATGRTVCDFQAIAAKTQQLAYLV